MAKRWTFKEDYIVCQYVDEHDIFISSRDLDSIVIMLKEQGYDRTRNSVTQRVYDYQKLLTGLKECYVVEQERRVSEWFIRDSQMDSAQRWISRYVEEVYCEENTSGIDDEQDVRVEFTNNTSKYIAIDTPVLESSFKQVLDELLEVYYTNHTTKGKTIWKVKQEFKDDLELTYGVPMNTFNAIHREKYDTVSKKVILKLCFALNLSYEDAERLLSSAGYRFRRNVKFEVVIASILKCNSPRRFIIGEIDQTLERHKCKTLFA
jgi:hypothetical protein